MQLMLRLIGKREGILCFGLSGGDGHSPVRSVVRYVIQAVLAGAAIILFFFSPLAAVAALVLNALCQRHHSLSGEPED